MTAAEPTSETTETSSAATTSSVTPATAPAPPPVVVVMGVSGSGKTTVATRVAERLGAPFAEADGFHSPANIAKMSAGTPLTDADRAPWLDAVAEWLAGHAGGEGAVVACSALKHRYRERLGKDAPGLFFLHLDGSPELIAERLAARKGHFMPPALLRSQFADLEALRPGERGAVVPIDGTVEQIVERALAEIRHAR